MNGLDKEIADLEKKKAAKDKDIATLQSKIVSIEKSINKNTSQSMLNSKRKQIASCESDMAKKSKDSADFGKKIADKRKKTAIYPGGAIEKQEHWNWRWSKTKVEWGIKNGFIVMKNTNNGWAVYFKQYEKVNNDDKPIVRTLSYQNFINIDGANSARGTREVMDLFDGKFFDYPKPLNLIMHVENMLLKSGDIILDFFSGSATTAHAVFQLNRNDGGNRKFILVQLPEKLDEKTEAYKAGYDNICEIGKERIRRAGVKIKKEAGFTTDNLDIGFRVLKCDSSNMKNVYYNPAEYEPWIVVSDCI